MDEGQQERPGIFYTCTLKHWSVHDSETGGKMESMTFCVFKLNTRLFVFSKPSRQKRDGPVKMNGGLSWLQATALRQR